MRYYKILDCGQHSDSALKTDRPQSPITFVMLKITKQKMILKSTALRSSNLLNSLRVQNMLVGNLNKFPVGVCFNDILSETLITVTC